MAPLIPRINSSLKRNNGFASKENLEKYILSLETMLSIAKQSLFLVEENVISNMNRKADESGKTLTVDGNPNFVIKEGESVKIGTPKNKKKSKKEE